MYAIKIVKIVDRSPEEIKEIRDNLERGRGRFDGIGMDEVRYRDDIERHREEKVLDVVLTDVEFSVVKKAVIDTM